MGVKNDGLAFTEELTDWLIPSRSLEDLPQLSREKLSDSGLGDYYDPCNFRLLIKKDQ
jgi:hypothetical protein